MLPTDTPQPATTTGPEQPASTSAAAATADTGAADGQRVAPTPPPPPRPRPPAPPTAGALPVDVGAGAAHPPGSGDDRPDRRGGGVARVPMATWVAGLGALLLLAAAATFLAVRWDALGPTARIAIVGGVTVAAVIGGDRLRRTLPAVGGVLFHLGALLVPIDALGLTLQFGAPGWVRWFAVGATGVVALPLLAVFGRAPLLAVIGLLGVPVGATGLAMLSGVPPALLVATVGLALAPLAAWDGPADLRPAVRLGSVLLPVLAVVGGVGLELVVFLGAEGVTATAAAAGWLAGWQVRAATAVTVIVALGARAHGGDPRLLAVTLVTGALAILHLVLAPATPRAVQLWTPAVLWLSLELAWLVLARDRSRPAGTPSGRRGLCAAILAAEVLAVPVALAATAVVFDPSLALGGDAVVAGAVAIAGAAWAAVAWRLERHGDLLFGPGVPGRPAVPLVVVLVVWHLVAAGLLAGVDHRLLLGGILVIAALPLAQRAASWRTEPGPANPGVALVAVVFLLGSTEGLTAGSAQALLVAVLAPVLVLPLLAPLTARGLAATGLLTVPVALLLVGLVGSLGDTGMRAVGLPGGAVGILVGVTAVAIAWSSAGSRPLATSARVLAVLVGLFVTLPAGALLPFEVVDAAVPSLARDLAGLSSGALLPSLVMGLLLAVDAVRDRGPVAATGAALVLLRVASAGALAGGADVEVVGAGLLAIGSAAAITAGVGARSLPRMVLVATSVVALLVAPIGWVLLGDAGVLRATALLLAGVGSLAVGLALQRWALAHTGAAIATLGTWSLLVQLAGTALDLFLLPVAVQLALAGASARRAGDTSSWIAYAPAVALVGVPAVMERVWGGPGWHGLLAGAVGVAAVTLGGVRGLRGPVVVGASLVVAVVVIETLTVVVGVPTWAWLTVGGVALLGAAALIERVASTPGEAARRVVAGLQDREW